MRYVGIAAVWIAVMAAAPAAWATETWTVATVSETHDGVPVETYYLSFTFNNGNLTVSPGTAGISAGQYHWNPVSGQWERWAIYAYYLKFRGTWARYGTYPDKTYVPDPYATFVIERDGRGHTVWAPATPQGYQTTLWVGDPYYDWSHGGLLTMPLVYREVDQVGYEEWTYDVYHTFTATYVPEPASLVAFALLSLPVVAAGLRRKGQVRSSGICHPGRLFGGL